MPFPHLSIYCSCLHYSLFSLLRVSVSSPSPLSSFTLHLFLFSPLSYLIPHLIPSTSPSPSPLSSPPPLPPLLPPPSPHVIYLPVDCYLELADRNQRVVLRANSFWIDPNNPCIQWRCDSVSHYIIFNYIIILCIAISLCSHTSYSTVSFIFSMSYYYRC